MSPKTRTLLQQMSDGVPIQQSNQQQNDDLSNQIECFNQLSRIHQQMQPQRHVRGNDHNQQHIDLIENQLYHTQQQQSNGVACVAVQLSTTGIASTPNDGVHHQSNVLQKCTRKGCTNQAITCPDWEDEYCSNECAVKHCGDVFGKWIQNKMGS